MTQPLIPARRVGAWGALIISLSTVILRPHACAAQAGQSTSELEVNLAVGENRTISAADVKSYSEGVAGIAEIKLTPNGTHFVIAGQKPGATTLLLIKRDSAEATWNINVFARPVQVVAAELSTLLADDTGIGIRKVGARFFIEGGVNSEADLQRIQQIAALYDGQVVSLVVAGGAAAARKINIRVDFYFVQYDKTKSRELGINWPSRLGGGALTFAYDVLEGVVAGAQASVAAQPLPTLDLAARNGWAKVLKHATVITSNGEDATFSSGGVQNFSISGLANSIHPIRFGTEVRVLPRFDPVTHELAVGIHADVSDLTPPAGATNLPGQNLSSLDTSVALKLGQSVVLSGIKTSDELYSTQGVPWLSEIPVLGLLFGAQTVRVHDVEGGLFIIPSVLDTSSVRADELIEHALYDYKRFDGDLTDVSPFQERTRATP